MLIKEDELVAELQRGKDEYLSIEKSVAEEMRKIEQEWDEEREGLYRELREAKTMKESLLYEIGQWQTRISERKQKFLYMSQQQQMVLRISEELLMMRRLRAAQQKNNYLKLKIGEANEIRRMLQQEKDIALL